MLEVEEEGQLKLCAIGGKGDRVREEDEERYSIIYFLTTHFN
jgi:hypothetical protein